jgi:hypothetical protein
MKTFFCQFWYYLIGYISSLFDFKCCQEKTVMKKYPAAAVTRVCLFSGFLLLASISAISAQDSNPFAGNPVNVADTKNAASGTGLLNASAAIDLTEEESKFMQMGLLPSYYPVLRECLDGKGRFSGKNGGLTAAKNLCKSFYPAAEGNFSRDFGNPVRMLDWARNNFKNEKLCQLVTATRRGDVILSGPSKQQEIDKNFICLMTKGPFYHASLVVDSVPPVIIEAVGITGNRFDNTSNKVRMSSWYEEFGSWGPIDWCVRHMVLGRQKQQVSSAGRSPMPKPSLADHTIILFLMAMEPALFIAASW